MKHRRTATILHAALLPLLALAFVLVGITHEVPLGDYRKDRGPAVLQAFADSRNLDEPTNVPEWSWVADDVGAVVVGPHAGIGHAVVVVDSGAEAQRMDLDRAHELTHDDERANDVWVVGTC